MRLQKAIKLCERSGTWIQRNFDVFDRTLCVVISYSFDDGDREMQRLFNEKDKTNLRRIFSGNHNQIKFISPSAKDIRKCLSSEEIRKSYDGGKYIVF